ncbi:hypothetical protein B0G76_6403 [Paraburkholderia sp. BL23I1N1]|uniref:hypothetical protein n=1 Tax=Paraburkholderia sp. BL23I1N1 TaxID=1938802 RepID=UPI000FF870B0|nr:hypothetical protein [Paraburkholderia sp. BL23I1N1]RKE39948.1 hypothetical protein B0G76_6403 [Paraburkholderia sp. BL23I1N1]
MPKASAPLPIDPLHDIDLQYGRFNKTTALDLSKAFDNFKENGTSGHLCVFFHGGLVSEAAGLSTAGQLIEGYTDSGAYPFFFIWKADLLTTVEAILEPYRDDPGFINAANYAVNTVARKICAVLDTDQSLKGQRPSAKVGKAAPMTLKALASSTKLYDNAWAKRAGAQLPCSSTELDQFAQWLVTAGKAVPEKRRLFSPKHLGGPQNPLARIIQRLNSGHDHGLYTTVVEELFIAAGLAERLGSPIWGEMKRFIDDSFSNDADAGGTAFLNHLCDAWDKNPQLRVTLIGHSAGAIYVQRFIEALDARLPASSTQRVEVIMLAAAITFDRMNVGLPILRKRVSGLRVFGLDNKTEGSYWEVPLVYNKSLLYLISSLCEADPNADKPLVGMQRYWKGTAPYTDAGILAAAEFIQTTRAVWSPTKPGAKPGYQSHAKRHGGFAEEEETNRSVCFVLQNGF